MLTMLERIEKFWDYAQTSCCSAPPDYNGWVQEIIDYLDADNKLLTLLRETVQSIDDLWRQSADQSIKPGDEGYVNARYLFKRIFYNPAFKQRLIDEAEARESHIQKTPPESHVPANELISAESQHDKGLESMQNPSGNHIRWTGKNSQLIYLIEKLRETGFLQQATDVKEVIDGHFEDENGKSFKNVSQAWRNIKQNKTGKCRNAEMLDKIITEVKNQ